MSPCPRCATPAATDAWFCGRCGLDLVTARGPMGAMPAASTAGMWPPSGPGASAWLPGAPVPLAPPDPTAADPGRGSSALPGPVPAPAPARHASAPAAAWGTPAPAPAWAATAPGGPVPGVPAPAWAAVLPPPGPVGAGVSWGASPIPTQPPGHTAGRVTMALLAVAAVLSGVLILLTLPLLDAAGWYGDVDAEAIDGASSLGSLAGLLVAVAYLCWSHQVTAGFPSLTGRRPRVGRLAVIGWWFVPLANLVMPPVAVADLSGGLALPGRRRAPWLLVAWWIAFLLSRILQTVWSVRINLLATDLGADAADYAASTNLLIAGEAFSIVAALALIAIIRGIAADSQARLAAMAVPAGWASRSSR